MPMTSEMPSGASPPPANSPTIRTLIERLRIMPDRPSRVLLVAGSQRKLNSCPGLDSKARALMHWMAAGWQVDLEDDLGNEHGKIEDPALQRLRLVVNGAVRLAPQLLRPA